MKSSNTYVGFFAAAVAACLCSPATAEILAVDFGASNKPVQTGFVGQSLQVFTHSTGSGDMTVSVKDADGTSTQGFNDKATNTPAYTGKDLYRDYIFNNTPGTDPSTSFKGMYLTLSGPAIASSTAYVLEFWVFNEGGARDSEFSGVYNTTGPVLSAGGPGGDYGDNGEQPDSLTA